MSLEKAVQIAFDSAKVYTAYNVKGGGLREQLCAVGY